MGFLDNASNLLNRGVANAGRGTKVISLKAQIADLGRSRNSLMAQLGESLYEETRTNDVFRNSREGLYASIENLDAQRAALQQELASVEQQMRPTPVIQPAAPTGFVAGGAPAARACSQCGSLMGPDDQFCFNCGARYESPAERGRVCAACGSALGPDDAFCMSCGQPVQAEPTAAENAAEGRPETVEFECAPAADAAPTAAEEPAAEPEPDMAPIAAAPTCTEELVAAEEPTVREEPADAPAGMTPTAAEELAAPVEAAAEEPTVGEVAAPAGAVVAETGEGAATGELAGAFGVVETADAVVMPPAAPAASAPALAAPPVEPAPFSHERICPACGYHASAQAAFCRNCGNRL